jgi:hypothetical protein
MDLTHKISIQVASTQQFNPNINLLGFHFLAFLLMSNQAYNEYKVL